MLSRSVLRGFYTSLHGPAQAPLQPIARGCSRSRTCAMRPFCAPALRGTLNKLEVEVGQAPACLGNLETGLAGGGGRLYLRKGTARSLGANEGTQDETEGRGSGLEEMLLGRSSRIYRTRTSSANSSWHLDSVIIHERQRSCAMW